MLYVALTRGSSSILSSAQGPLVIQLGTAENAVWPKVLLLFLLKASHFLLWVL